MGWGLLLYCILVFPFLVKSHRGLAVLVLLVWFVVWLVRRLSHSPPPESQNGLPPKTPPSTWAEAKSVQKGLLSQSGLHDLLLLRLDLNRQLADGRISAERHQALALKIDQLWAFHLSRFGVSPNTPLWDERRETGWAVLQQFSSLPLGAPPWHEAPPATEEAAPRPAQAWQPGAALDQSQQPPEQAPSLPARQAPAPSPKPAPPPTPTPTEPPPRPVFLTPGSPDEKIVAAIQAKLGQARDALSAAPQPDPAPPKAARPPAAAKTETPPPPRPAPPRPDYAWQPSEPSALEKALKTVSGWSAWLVPFLVQNIGWFVGGFCFIAGSVFLVAYTGGFANACAVFFVLLAYGALLLWGGYQLRSKRPELLLSSSVLIALSTLLVPLTLASAMRMILAADSAGLGFVAALVAAGYSAGAYGAVTLAFGLSDRSLQGRHTSLFLALCAAQWAVPLLRHWPEWPLLALLHLGLLGLLGHGLAQFTGGWLHSLFVEQRKTAYHAAGTLVYAGTVSFIHLTFGAGTIALPDGYFGPFVMALAGLLFRVDAELKQWSDRHVRLSRFSFALYGLSALALALVFGHTGAAIVTLLVGIGVYASVIWRYLTFPPLVLFTVCAFWLYALLVLRFFDARWHLLLSLPGLALLHTLTRRALARRSAYLAGLSLSCLALTLAVLLGWSLGHGGPSWVALASVLVALALAHSLARLFPRVLLEPLPLLAQSRWLADGREIYLLALLHLLGVAYMPLLPWTMQTAYGAWALAGVWTALGLANRRRPAYAEAWLNCALPGLLLGLALAFSPASGIPVPAALALLALSGGIFAWQSLGLYERGFFYTALLCWGLAAAAVKLAYFPAHGTGAAGFWLAFGLCALAWHLARRSAKQEAWRREQRALGLLDAPPPLTLLGLFRVGDSAIAGIGELLCLPLRQTAALLWLLGLALWLRRLGLQEVGFAWISAALPGSFAAIALAGHFRIAHWPVAPMSLVLLAALVALENAGLGGAWLCVAALAYAWLAWRVGILLIAHPLSLKLEAALDLALGLAKPADLEQDAHHISFLVALAALAALPFTADAGTVPVACALALGIGFFHATGWRYLSVPHSYLVLGLAVVASLRAYQLILPNSPSGAGLLADLGLAYWGLALALERKTPGGFEASVYRKPLCHAALSLGWLGAALALAQFAERGAVLDFGTIVALGLSALAMRLANQRLAVFAMNACADLFAALALVWLEFRLFHGPVRFDPGADDVWITLALLASAFSLRVASFLRIKHWPPLPMLLALAAGLGVLRLADFGSPALCLSTVLYGWLVWRVGLVVFAHPWCQRLASLLRLELGLEQNRASLGGDLHHTGVAASLLALAVALADAGHAPVGVTALTLLATAGFVYDAGRHYRSLPHSYGLLALAVIGAELAYWHVLPDGAAQRGHAAYLALLALAFWALARGLALVRDDADFEASLYRKPLHEMGLLLGWIVVALSLLRVSTQGWIPDSASIAALGLAAAGFLLCNRRLRWPGQDLASVLLAVLALLWLEAWLLHPGLAFDPWADPFGDIWPTLALLAFGLMLLGSWLEAGRETLAAAAQCLGLLLGVRVFVPFALLRLPLLLGFAPAGGGVRLLDALLPLLLAGLLPFTFGIGRLAIHASIAAGLCAAWTVYLSAGFALFHPPLLFALSCLALLSAAAAARRWPASALPTALESWALLCLVAALALLPRFVLQAPAESLLTALLVTGLSAALAYARQSIGLLYLAATLAAIVLHGWLWVLLRPNEPFQLLPWYALQWALLLWFWPDGKARLADGWLGDAQRCLRLCRDGVAALLVGELALHGVVWVFGFGIASHAFSGAAHLAALAAATLLLVLESRRLQGQYDSPKVYALALLVFAIVGYMRLLAFGPSELGLPDAALLIVATFAATFLHRLTLSTPLLRIATFLPLLALLTVRWELASASGSATLLALGGVYVWLSYAMGKRLPVYLGLLFMNIGVYLWVPYVAEQAHLLQVYVIPAAISVLLMLHLHKRELRPETLNASRLAATATLYGCATLDVFLRPEFGVFLLALGLSLASLLAGVALRVRAFVYSGLCFLVLNIAGQLGQLYPEGRLARAIVLMGLGSAITVAMIFFQLKREAVLRRIRAVRADLAGWE